MPEPVAAAEQASSQASVEARAAELLFGKPKQLQQPPKPQAPPAAPAAQEMPEAEAESTEQAEQTDESNAPPVAETVEELFELEVDGETYALPKKLEKAVMASRDYTQQKQKVSDRERQYEVLHEQAKIANFRQAFETDNADSLQKLRAYDAVLAQPVDWSTMSTDEALRT